MTDTPLVRVLHANQQVIDHRWQWRLSDPFWRLYFNREAGAAVANEHRRWPLPAERALLVPAWGDFRATCTAPVRHFYVHFETPGLSAEWIRRTCAEPLLLPENAVLRAMIDELARAAVAQSPVLPQRDGRWRDRAPITGDARWRLRVEAAAAWALALALDQLAPGAMAELNTRGPAGPDADLEPALRLLRERPADAVTVMRLAKQCGLSRDHFARRFAGATGRTVMRYVQERRVAVAAERLLHGRDAIDDVARAAGFANRFHFTRVFTRLIGTPPAQYRRQHRP